MLIVGTIGVMVAASFYMGIIGGGEDSLREDLADIGIKSYHMTIYNENNEIRQDVWVRGVSSGEIDYYLDIKIDNIIPVTQIYNYDREALYTTDPGDLETEDLMEGPEKVNEELEWTKKENLTVEQLKSLDLLIGFGFWAEEYGEGTHEIELENEVLRVKVHEVNEELPDDVFNPPENVEFRIVD